MIAMLSRTGIAFETAIAAVTGRRKRSFATLAGDALQCAVGPIFGPWSFRGEVGTNESGMVTTLWAFMAAPILCQWEL
jgi:hypothetical protein